MQGVIGHQGRARDSKMPFAAAATRPSWIVLALCLLAPAIATAGTASAWSLLPQPSVMRPEPSGTVTVSDGALVAVRAPDPTQVQPIADRFIQLVAHTRGLHLKAAGAADTHAVISFEVQPHADVGGDTGYRIVLSDKEVRVIARSSAGAFYGGVTLWQLLTPPGWKAGTSAQIARGVIEDQPRFAWRALLLDSGRHFQSVADIEKLIDWMSLDKLNVLIWHLTEDQGWRLETRKYPELTQTGACRKAVGLDIELSGGPGKPYCGFYTQAQVKELVSYAAARFVTVVPEIDMPGHSQAAVAAYPWLGVTGKRPQVWTDWGISPWLLKPDGKTLQFVNDVLDEAMQLFPAPYISIGGDEADKQQWNASPELRAQLSRLKLANMDQLQGWFTGEVADHLVKHGRTPVGWDDELVAGARLPESEIVMSWHGNDSGRVALEAARQGHKVILTPQESLYFDHSQSDRADEWTGQPPLVTLQQAYDTAVIAKGATSAEAQHVIGVQGNLWTELMLSFDDDQHALFPRIAALAELGWSPASAHDWNGFLRRLPGELARYRAVGIGYADSAFAPKFDVSAGSSGMLRVSLSNQTSFGDIRYTTDGSAPTANSSKYVHPLELAHDKVTIRAATFDADGFELAASRTMVVDDSSLLSRDGNELELCSKQSGMRVGGDLPATGRRPVYSIEAGDMCWLWPGFGSQGMDRIRQGIDKVTLNVARVAWRFGDEAAGAVVRPTTSAAGEFEIHAQSCTGPLLATLPLAPAVRVRGESALTAKISPGMNGARDLCIFATGDPRAGQWVLARVAFSK